MNLETAIKGILAQREAIHKGSMWNDPVNLSEIALKCTVYNGYLADYIAGLHKKNTDDAYAAFIEARNNGIGVTQAEVMSKGETAESREEYEHVKMIYGSTGSLITMIQVRLKVLENQLRQEVQNG